MTVSAEKCANALWWWKRNLVLCSPLIFIHFPKQSTKVICWHLKKHSSYLSWLFFWSYTCSFVTAANYFEHVINFFFNQLCAISAPIFLTSNGGTKTYIHLIHSFTIIDTALVLSLYFNILEWWSQLSVQNRSLKVKLKFYSFQLN